METGIDHFFQRTDLVGFAAVADRKADTGFAGPSRTTAAVRVYFNIIRQFEVDHMRNAIHVDTPCGHVGSDEELQVAQQIADSKADILFVAMSSPKKEIFLNTYKKEINIPFIMGVGGSFDVVAGFVKRAPMWMQRYSLEWLHRAYTEPRRLVGRYARDAFLILPILVREFRLRQSLFMGGAPR